VPLVKSVREVEDLDSLLNLLSEELDWPLDPDYCQEDITFEWTADELRLPESADERFQDGVVHQLRPMVRNQPWGIFLVQFKSDKIYKTALRQVLRGLVPGRRKSPHLQSWQHDNLLFICTTADCDRFTFAHFRCEKAHRAKLSTFSWEEGDPYVRTLCEYNLPALRWPEDDGEDPDAWVKSWTGAFDKEPLTRKFFKRFDTVLDAAREDLEEYQDFDSADAYSRAQILLERLIFLYFLQNRGWLDQNADYLLSHFRPHRDRPDEFSYYEEFLEPLFWTLATAPGAENRLDGIPFLNGGLFDDDEFEPTEQRKQRTPPLKIRNATFTRIFNQLLEAFNFTVTEDTPLDQDVAVDPEMLGKVFESLVLHAEQADPDAVAPDKRKETGSYYTPRIVVHFICRESLIQYLVNHLEGEGWNDRLRSVFQIEATDGLAAEDLSELRGNLTPEQGQRLGEALKGLKCCDPAVGSGAFPVGLMHELVRLRRLAEAAANGYVDPEHHFGTAWIHDTKAEIVENCLFGVDIQQQAIEICRLRLWLSLVVDYDLGVDPFAADPARFERALERMSQLPNLEMNFKRGDSLHDHISGVPVLIDRRVAGKYRDQFQAIQTMGAELHRAKKAHRKKDLRLRILGTRLQLTKQVLTDELRKLDTQHGSLVKLPGFDTIDSDAEKRRRLKSEMDRVREALDKMEKDSEELQQLRDDLEAPDFYPRLRRLEGADFDSPFNFAWRLDFPAIFGREDPGFDIVVGNPPFVTARNPEKRELWRNRWPQVCYRTYHMLCPFFALSFGILRDDGELGFIVSNAFATREFGKPLVEEFFPTVDLQKVVDCKGLSFPGHGTPTCIVHARNEPSPADTNVRVTGLLPGGGDQRTPPENSSLWKAIEEHHDDPGYEDDKIAVADQPMEFFTDWPVEFDVFAEELKTTVDSVSKTRVEDHLSAAGRIFATSADDIFLLPPHVVRKQSLKENVFPVVEGEEIRDWTDQNDSWVVCPYNEQWELTQLETDSPLTRWLRQFRDTLGQRKSFSGDTYDEAGIPWYGWHQLDTAKAQADWFVAYPEIATHGHFVFETKGTLFTQTSPVLAPAETLDRDAVPLLTAVLNASITAFWLKQMCYNKGAGASERRDRFVYSCGRVEQIPLPSEIDNGLGGTHNHITKYMRDYSHSCSKRGEKLSALAFNKILEKRGEAYQEWNCSLPGYVTPHKELSDGFQDAAELRASIDRAVSIREQLRQEMVARQEEIDWLAYQAYELIDEAPVLNDESDLQLQRHQRPFRFWMKAGGDLSKALSLIPDDWSEEKRRVWRERLEIIRDNEHVRRIEKPVYKRRWDEQWKVGNSWQCGQVAYDQEFLDAFDWWLSEKAEHWLEHQADGGPVDVETWAKELWQDDRVQAAWEVAAETEDRIKNWKRAQKDEPPLQRDPKTALSGFAHHLKYLVRDQSVPEGIPWAVPWDELEEQGIKVPTRTRRIRGKYNVPRERFRTTASGLYQVAQPLDD
jgi:hypothetical protein